MSVFGKSQKDFYKYQTQVTTFILSNRMKLDEFCNGFVAVNTGDTGVKVGNKYLKPYPAGHPEVDGGSWGAFGNAGEIYIGENGILDIVFDAAPGAAPSVDIIQKFYLIDKW